jgi:hypothetical protein
MTSPEPLGQSDPITNPPHPSEHLSSQRGHEHTNPGFGIKVWAHYLPLLTAPIICPRYLILTRNSVTFPRNLPPCYLPVLSSPLCLCGLSCSSAALSFVAFSEAERCGRPSVADLNKLVSQSAGRGKYLKKENDSKKISP